MIEEGDLEMAEREQQYRQENIESRVTVIEDMTQLVMKEYLQKEREDIRSFKAGLETRFENFHTLLEASAESRREYGCLYDRGQALGAEINRSLIKWARGGYVRDLATG